jgi:hypothetical protein
MENRKLALSILGIVSVLALAGLVLMFRGGATGLQIAYTYEQPASHKPLFIQPSYVLENFNLCNQYVCTQPVSDIFYGEATPAEQVGIDTLTGNLRCGCPDGREFYIRPDYILPGIR